MFTAPRIRSVVENSFIALGTILTLYIAISVFGFISNSKVYYATFVFFIMCMSSLHAFKELLDDYVSGTLRSYWKTRLGIAIVGTVLAVGCSAYVRIHAIRLDSVHPFFDNFDITIGILFIVGIMLLNFLHWGWLLTSLIVIIICYFFYRSPGALSNSAIAGIRCGFCHSLFGIRR